MNVLERILPGLAAAPNIHPMLVHFPAALFPVALLLAFGALARPRWNLAAPARLLVAASTLGAIAAATTGFLAQEAMPHGPGTIVATHRSFMIAVGILALLLSGLSLRRRESPGRGTLRVLVAGLVALNILLVLGADRGALVASRLQAGLDLSLPPVEPSMSRGNAVRRDTTGGVVPGDATGDSSPGDTTGKPAPGSATRGSVLYAALECGSCHEPEASAKAPGIPPTLAYAGSKLREEWIREYLLHPYRIRFVDLDTRPIVRMPDFQLGPDEAADLAAFLAARQDTAERFPSLPVEDPPLTQEEARQGRDLIAQYACKGCHMIGGTGNRQGPSLDGTGDRLRPAYVYAFLRDPRAIIPRTSMKDFGLWEEEARSLTAYLMTLHGKEARSPSATAVDSRK